MTQAKHTHKDKIHEIMGLMSAAIEKSEQAEHLRCGPHQKDALQHADELNSIVKAVESKLRELVREQDERVCDSVPMAECVGC